MFRECQPARAVETVSNLWKLFIALIEQCESAFDVSQLGNSSADGLVFDTGLEDDEDDGGKKDEDGNADNDGDDGAENGAGKQHSNGNGDMHGVSNRNPSNNDDHSTRWYESRIQRAERQHRDYVLCQTRAQRSQVCASF